MSFEKQGTKASDVSGNVSKKSKLWGLFACAMSRRVQIRCHGGPPRFNSLSIHVNPMGRGGSLLIVLLFFRGEEGG